MQLRVSFEEAGAKRPGRSKIFISIVYLWTGRGPEINNEIGTAAAAVLFRNRARSENDSWADDAGWCRGGRGTAAVAAGGRAAEGGPVLADGRRVRGGQRGGCPVGAGPRGVRGADDAGGGAWRPGPGGTADAGGVCGADDGSGAGPADRHEPESGGGAAECDGTAR